MIGWVNGKVIGSGIIQGDDRVWNSVQGRLFGSGSPTEIGCPRSAAPHNRTNQGQRSARLFGKGFGERFGYDRTDKHVEKYTDQEKSNKNDSQIRMILNKKILA